MIRFIKKHTSKIIAAIVAVTLMFGAKMPSFAAGSYTVDGVLTYAVSDELFTFLNLGDDVDPKSFVVDISSEDIERKTNGSLKPFATSGNSIHYVFIVDASGSMKRYLKQINAFAEELFDETEGNSYYTLATFGERFDVIKEKMTDVNTLTHEIESVIYNEQYTDPYTAVISAKTWLNSYEIKSGDIVELILITDGEPDLKDKDKEDRLAQKAGDVLEDSWDFIFNTFCTNEWTEKAEEIFLSDNRGVHSTVADEDEAKDAADKIAGSFESIWYAETELKDKAPDSFSYTFRMIGKDKEGNQLENLEPVTFDSVKRVDAESSEGIGEGGDNPLEGPAPIDLPIAPPGTEPKEDEPEDESPAPIEGPSEDKDEEPSEDKDEEPSEDKDEPEGEKDRDEDEDDDDHHTGLVTQNNGSGGSFADFFDSIRYSELFPLYIALAVILLLVIIAVPIVIVIVVVNVKKKKNANPRVNMEPINYNDLGSINNPGQTVNPVDPNSIPMELEVQAGVCLNKDRTVYILNEIRIGRDSGCDIVFSDPALMPVQARILRNGDDFIIEDFSNPSTVAIGGMKINGRNPLRTGDVITVGNIQFVLRF